MVKCFGQVKKCEKYEEENILLRLITSRIQLCFPSVGGSSVPTLIKEYHLLSQNIYCGAHINQTECSGIVRSFIVSPRQELARIELRPLSCLLCSWCCKQLQNFVTATALILCEKTVGTLKLFNSFRCFGRTLRIFMRPHKIIS